MATQHVAGRGTPLIEKRAWEACYSNITLGRSRRDMFSEPHRFKPFSFFEAVAENRAVPTVDFSVNPPPMNPGAS